MLYDNASLFITHEKSRFYEWIFDTSDSFLQGQICASIVWYEEKDRWFLVEDFFGPPDEPNTTWLAKPVRGNFLPEPR